MMNIDSEHIKRWFTPFVQRVNLIFWLLILCPLCRLLSLALLQISLIIVAVCLYCCWNFLLCEILWNCLFIRWQQVNAHRWASHSARWKVDWTFSGTVFYMMYILYCSTHCHFYCWEIKQRGKTVTTLFYVHFIFYLAVYCLVFPFLSPGPLWFAPHTSLYV